MSKVYYDKLLVLNEIEDIVKKKASSIEEREELWEMIDEIIHHKAMGFVLTHLHKDSHEEFLEIFHKCPHDEIYIFSYLEKKVGPNIKDMMKNEFKKMADEIRALLV